MKTCSATKPKHQILISPEAILQSSLSSGLNRTVSSSWLKFGGLWKSRRADTTGAEIGLPVGAGINSASSLERLRTSHAFLAYASEFWLHHTRTFAKDKTQSWNLWATLIHSEDSLAGLPWALDEWKMCSINVLEWISGHNHEGLLSLIQQCSTTNIPVESLRPLFPIIAAEARAEFLNILVQSQDGTIEDFETAMKMPLYRSSEQFSVLQAAVYQGDREIVEKLIHANADVNAAPYDGYSRTALQLAVKCGHLDVVNVLISAGADVNAAPSNYGRTALQAAAERGSLQLVNILLSADADINAGPSYSGRTAVQQQPKEVT